MSTGTHLDAPADVSGLREALDAEIAAHRSDNALHARMLAQQTRDFIAALARERREIDATHALGSAVRDMCLPGVKRKTLRVDDLRALIAKIDERASAVGKACECETTP